MASWNDWSPLTTRSYVARIALVVLVTLAAAATDAAVGSGPVSWGPIFAFLAMFIGVLTLRWGSKPQSG